MRPLRFVLAAVLLASVSTGMLADEWIAERLRGNVLMMQGGDWVSLSRGQAVPDGGKVRTESDGRVELIRGQERIAVAANSEISIRDAAGQKMTSVIQSRGTVTVQAEKRNVQHFSVQTPVLAAVVKGTQFTVTYSNGQASVAVDNGVVQVQDAGHDTVVDVTAGQTASASQSRPVDVTGPGSERAIFLIDGEVVPAPARAAVLSGAIAPAQALEALRNAGQSTEAVVAAGGVAVQVGSGHSGTGGQVGAGVSAGSGGGSAGVVAGPVSVGAGAGSGGVDAGVSAGPVSVGTNIGSSGISAGVNAGSVGAGVQVGSGSSGSGGGISVGVSLGGLGSVGVNLGGSSGSTSGSSNSGSGSSNSGSGSSGSGSGSSGSGGSGSSGGLGISVNVGGLGLRL